MATGSNPNKWVQSERWKTLQEQKREYLKVKLMSLQRTVTTKTLEVYVEE
jgi:hypothetical protein